MNGLNRLLAKMAFRGQTKVRILRQLQRLIKAEVPLTKSLDMLINLYSKDGKKPGEPLALMIGEWNRRLKSGKSLSISMRGWISSTEEMIIEAGEQSDMLARSLEDALKANGAAGVIRKTIIGGLLYPIILLLMLCATLWGFSTSMVPTYATIVPPEKWTGNPAVMYAVSQFITNWFLIIAGATVATTTAIILTFPILCGPIRVYLDRLPPWTIYKITQGSSYMITMRGFLSAGMPIPDALRKMQKTGNPYFRERVGAILAKVNMGRNLGQAMKEAGHNFPDDQISGEVSIYAGLEDFQGSLDLLAKEWIDNAIGNAQVATKALSTIMTILVGLCVCYIAVTMFELQDIIQRSARGM
jgi:type II secretory pathway component PulF